MTRKHARWSLCVVPHILGVYGSGCLGIFNLKVKILVKLYKIVVYITQHFFLMLNIIRLEYVPKLHSSLENRQFRSKLWLNLFRLHAYFWLLRKTTGLLTLWLLTLACSQLSLFLLLGVCIVIIIIFLAAEVDVVHGLVLIGLLRRYVASSASFALD